MFSLFRTPHTNSVHKEFTCNAGGLGLIPGLGRLLWRGNGSTLQYYCSGSSGTEEPAGLQSMGSQESGTAEPLNRCHTVPIAVEPSYVGAPWRFCRFVSSPLQWSEYGHNKARHRSFWFPRVFKTYVYTLCVYA